MTSRGRLVDADLDHLRGVAEAHGRADRAAAVLAALRVRRGGEGALDGDRALVDQRGRHHVGEGQAGLIAFADAEHLAGAFDILRPRLELARGGGDEHRLELLGGVDRRVADHEGDARRIGAVVLGRDRGVGGDDANAVERDVQRLGDRDRHHGGGALADIGGAGERRNAAVEVELEIDHRVRLAGAVDRLGGAADIMRAGHAEPLAGRQLAEPLAPAARALDLVEAFVEAVAVHRQVVHRAHRRLQQIGAAHGERIEPEFARHAVDQAFEGVAHVDRAVPAHGAAGRQIGVDAVAVVFDRGNVVDAVQQRAGIENGDDAVAGIGAAALHHLAFAGGHAPVFVHAELRA